MPKMNPEIKAKWVAALRDPSRKQIKGRLRRGDGMCCLGVLCDVVDATGWQAHVYDHDVVYAHIDETAMPAAYVSDVVGFNVSYARLTLNDRTEVAAVHNDEFGATFLQIADAVEEQW